MSLGTLTGVPKAFTTATIQRVAPKQGPAMGQNRTGPNDYTATNRGALPTTSVGRLVQGGGDRRLAFEMHDLETPAKWYTTTNPQVNESALFLVSGVRWFVHNVSIPDSLNRYWIIDVKQYSRGIQ